MNTKITTRYLPLSLLALAPFLMAPQCEKSFEDISADYLAQCGVPTAMCGGRALGDGLNCDPRDVRETAHRQDCTLTGDVKASVTILGFAEISGDVSINIDFAFRSDKNIGHDPHRNLAEITGQCSDRYVNHEVEGAFSVRLNSTANGSVVQIGGRASAAGSATRNVDSRWCGTIGHPGATRDCGPR